MERTWNIFACIREGTSAVCEYVQERIRVVRSVGRYYIIEARTSMEGTGCDIHES